MTRKRTRTTPTVADTTADATAEHAAEPPVEPAGPAPVPTPATPPAGEAGGPGSSGAGRAGRALATTIRSRVVPAIVALARGIGALASSAWRRIRPGLGRIAASARAWAQRAWARLDSRGRVVVLGGAAGLVVLVAVAVSLRPGGEGVQPQPSGAPTSAAVQPTLSPEQVDTIVGNVLPTPTTTDTVLLVSDASSLSASEQAWLTDLRAQLGNVDPVAYGEVTLERLREYFVVFVIDRSDALDPAVLAAAHEAGLAIHLIGAAAAYRDQVAGPAQ
jgi:hypothetical protein